MTETKEKLKAPSCPTLLEVEDYFESAGIPVREGDLHYYVDFFRIASELSGHKLDKWELLEAFDFIREMLLGRKPEIVQHLRSILATYPEAVADLPAGPLKPSKQ